MSNKKIIHYNMEQDNNISRQQFINSGTTLTWITTSFYKFLARFSGRRRKNLLYETRFFKLVLYTTLLSSFLLFTGVTDACSSRTTPKPRPITPSVRPNITFHTYACPPTYAAWYCLNEARCFTVKISDSLLYSCECAEGYMGPRCEYKDLDGSYLPTRQRVLMQTASLASGATLVVLMIVILGLVFYVRYHQSKKKEHILTSTSTSLAAASPTSTYYQQEYQNGNDNIDTVDGLHTVRCGPPELRPFGPHHQKIIPMAEAFKR